MKRLAGIVLALVILVAALSSHGKTSNSTTTSAGPVTPSTAAPPTRPTNKPAAAHVQYAACDQNISAGPRTTCGFAANVFRAFAAKVSSEGSEPAEYIIQAASPATGKTYAMSCRTSAGTTQCAGGTSARVRFPLHAAQVYNRTAPPKPETPPPSSETPASESPGSESPEPTEPSSPEPSECTSGTYVNAAGNTVCRPVESPSGPPAGASAECSDGTYSFSESRSGTCSHHGGVANWLH
jgi:hypothetical protein